ncbi:MAG: ParB/RepB/Spo0J family partition protein [Flavobacteriaceae bacterium]
MAKATRKQAMGRGLSALLPSIDETTIKNLVGAIIDLELDAIEINPFQPRTHFNEESLQELASSIKELGVIQPVTVRKLDNDKFQLVAGERRFRASKIVGNKTIPAYIRTANDHEMLEMALVENIQRKDLDPIEVALSYQRMIDEIKLTQEQMSERVGKKRSTITNYLRLLKLDPIVQTGMRDNFISMGHGRALINIDNQDDQITIYETILQQKLSVRQTEALVKSFKDGNQNINAKIPSTKTPSYITESLKSISEYFGHKVDVKVSGKNKGKIVIPFHSEEDFNRIKKLLK